MRAMLEWQGAGSPTLTRRFAPLPCRALLAEIAPLERFPGARKSPACGRGDQRRAFAPSSPLPLAGEGGSAEGRDG
jgi:hypothetical protein